MEAPQHERRLAAILAADVEGYSRLMHGDEQVTMRTLSARRALVDNLIREHQGRIANTAGDSIMVEFSSVLNAVSCAVEIQKAIYEINRDDAEQPMQFRIGLNVCDIMDKDGDIFGDGVNIAARLEGLATGGGVCVSRSVRDQLLRTNLTFEDLGELLVKNIAGPIQAYRLRLGDDAGQTPAGAVPAGAVPPGVGRVDAEKVQSQTPSLPPAKVAVTNVTSFELSLWESVKAGRPTELASYLEHYPTGTFASLARTRQTAGTEASADNEVALELALWESVKGGGPEELASYLEHYPIGTFASLARTRQNAVEEVASVAEVPPPTRSGDDQEEPQS